MICSGKILLAKPDSPGSLDTMKSDIYIPPSCRTAEKHLAFAFKKGLPALTKKEFVRGWCSLSFLYPGLHPDGFASRGSGWPGHFKPFAAEAWRRFKAGELTGNELHCYQAAKARITMERGMMPGPAAWLSSDHFAA
jgi:hypothetical protein